MIIEDYCSVELAEALQRHGADVIYNHFIRKSNVDGTQEIVLTCTHQSAMKWLREEKYVIIFILPTKDEDGNFAYYYDIAEWDESEGVYEMNRASNHFYCYEKAVEAALKYALENLIEKKTMTKI